MCSDIIATRARAHEATRDALVRYYYYYYYYYCYYYFYYYGERGVERASGGRSPRAIVAQGTALWHATAWQSRAAVCTERASGIVTYIYIYIYMYI